MKDETYFTEDLHSLKKYWEDEDRAKKFLAGGTRTGAVKYLILRIELDIHQGSWLDTGTGSGFVQTLVDPNVIPTIFVGLDFSGVMLRAQESPFGERVIGSAFHLPFRHSSFKVVTNIFSLSDYPTIEQAFVDLGRVVSKMGSFLHLDYAIGDDYWEMRKQLHNTKSLDGKIIVGNINLRSIEKIKNIIPGGMRIVFQEYLDFKVKSDNLTPLFDLPDQIMRKFIFTHYYKFKSQK